MIPGSRVFVGDDCATIRFVGKLPGKENEFLGLEWDSLTRGTHTGEFEGVSFFRVRPGGSGSFVRADSASLRFGRVASEVLTERYEQPAAVQPEELYALTGREARVAIQLVLDEESAVPVERLESASLAASRITKVDALLAARCPALKELDLSSNALASLRGVLGVLPSSLRSLNLSLNPLWEEDDEGEEKALPVLETLAVAGSQVGWRVLLSVLPPSLRCLDLSECLALGAAVPPQLADCCSQLTQLHLNGIGLREWAAFGPCLERLELLERLFLSDNPLCELGPSLARCTRLELLAVSNTQLRDWAAWTCPLVALPGLRHVRFAGTPCHGEPRARLTLLGLLPQLSMLNGALVSEREKQDAEIIRLKQREPAAGAGAAASAGAAATRPPLSARVTATNGKQSPVFALSPETTVAMLRDMAFRHTGVPPFRQRVWARCAQSGEVQRTLLDQEAATLDWYGFVAGLIDVLIEEAE